MNILFAKSAPEWTPLKEHLLHVSYSAKSFAKYLGMNENIAYAGAIMHDIGKAHPEFQKRLKGSTTSSKIFRHEISSLLFLSAFPAEYQDNLIEMVAAHHKSIKKDAGEKGLLDLDDGYDYEDFHVGDWDSWSIHAFDLLNELQIHCKPFNKLEAINNLCIAVNFCKKKVKERGYSEWRGLLMGSDHYASALINETEKQLSNAFKIPDLSFYNRKHELYPLSYKNTLIEKKHTIVVASTGAGKTDYLFKRTKGRVFYTLPFQASINAMFKRVARDLEPNNPHLDIRVLHSSSIVVRRTNEQEETALQSLFGSSIKILTPHQMASIAFGTKGYEAMLLDLKECDVILDEIHTYTGISQAIVLKLVQILKQLNCRIHIGTATMPSVLYDKILSVLGDNVHEEKLSNDELDKFDRHVIHKRNSFQECLSEIENAIERSEKILVVYNTVSKAQQAYCDLKEKYEHIPILLLHSRFKRGDRNAKELQLLGIDELGSSTFEFNTAVKSCIVISTQIVEVSLDVSFDLMITETAPIDALIQRFGRINRKRSLKTIGQTKNIYVIKPSDDKREAKPYNPEILNRSFEVLPNAGVLRERELQSKIDFVYPTIDFEDIEEHSVFKEDGRITIEKLKHRPKSYLFDLLEIDFVSCICEGDIEVYSNSRFEERLQLEIPIHFSYVGKMEQLQVGNKPFIIPNKAYNADLGLDVREVLEKNFDVNRQLI